MIGALIILSMAGLGYLAATDAKRRRTAGQATLDARPFFWPARVFAFAPGLYLVGIGHWSGLTIWAGAVTVLAWIMAAIPPSGYAHFVGQMHAHSSRYLEVALTFVFGALDVVSGYVQKLGSAVGPLMVRKPRAMQQDQDTISDLKARILELEARLVRLEDKDADRLQEFNPITIEGKVSAAE